MDKSESHETFNNSKSLLWKWHIWYGHIGGECDVKGTKSISQTAALIKKSAAQHPVNFQPPVVVFWFVKGITDDVIYDLQSMVMLLKVKTDYLKNIIVRGEKVTEDSYDQESEGEVEGIEFELEKNTKSLGEKLEDLVQQNSTVELELPLDEDCIRPTEM